MSAKTSGQQCPLARSLDVVGERWGLLIVRELELGPRSYRDLQNGLPGIAASLLAERLNELQAAGVVEPQPDARTSAACSYGLTQAGRELRPVIDSLMAWGLRHGQAAQPGDVMLPRWVLPAVGGRPTRLPNGRWNLHVDSEWFTLAAEDGALRVRAGCAPDAELTVQLSAEHLYGLMTGGATGVKTLMRCQVEGNRALARRVLEALSGTLA